MRWHGVSWTILLFLTAGAFAGSSCAAEKPLHPYRVIHGWPDVPDNEMLDEVSAVAVDGRDNVLILTRAGRKWPDSDVLDTSTIEKPTIFLLDGKTGRQLRHFGDHLFALPHSITVDASGNIWVADVALHQVFKLAADGRVLLTLGERAKPGEDQSHFNRPSDVAIGPDGTIYVTDGYGNNRVVKFDASGKFLLNWGSKGSAASQFNLPHGLAIDRAGHVCVDDRQNARVQCFDPAGRYLFTWKGPPFISPQDVKFGLSGRTYVAEGGNADPPDRSGILVLDGDGKLLERVGRYGNYDGQFEDPHWVAVDSTDNIYVADFTGRRVQKFTRNR